MNKCYGCGVNTENDLCERCFRIRNYNDYKKVNDTNEDYIPILKKINKTNDLVVLVVDLFNVNDMSIFNEYLKNDILLVLTKRDLLPKSVYDQNLLNYNYNIKCKDKIIISSKKNLQFDELLEKINTHKKSNKVYIVGYTNAGKSTMINKIIYNYSDLEQEITTSPISSTTLNEIEIKINDALTLIDTPGILLENDLVNIVEPKKLKTLVPNKEIKPITYQTKEKQYIQIEDLVEIETQNINLTFYISNALKINRVYKQKQNNMIKTEIKVNNQDIVIRGLGFISTKQKGIITIYTKDKVDIFTRDRLI